MDSSEIRGDIIDRGIEKAEREMTPVLQRISDRQRQMENSAGSSADHGTAPDSTQARTPMKPAQGEDLPERAGISRKEGQARERKVDPEAVRESSREAELDPAAEVEPEEGEKAA